MRPHITIVLALVGLAALAVACSDGATRQDEGRLKVVASLPLLADFVRQVGGDQVAVFALLPAGADPHTFQPTPRDVQRLAEADLLIVNGLGLEGPSLRLIENNKPAHVPLVKLAEQTAQEGLVGVIDGGNPHLWLDASLASHYVEIIREALASIDPAGATSYQANADAYREQLRSLDGEIKGLVASIPIQQRKLVTFHDSFPYLARAYGLEVVGAVLPSPAGDASPRDLAHLLTTIRQEGIPAVFVEPQFNADLLDGLAAEAGVSVCTLYSDALDGQVQTYIELMRFNANELARCLGGTNGY